MAQTGKWVPISPGAREGAAVPRVNQRPEASTQTYLKGAPVMRSVGYISAQTVNNATAILGFARIAGQSGASDGAKDASYFVATPQAWFCITMSGTLAQSHFGSVLGLISNASTQWYAATLTSISSTANLRCEGWDTTRWAIGDVNPEIFVSLIGSVIQGNT
jgi:hypothetical protein